MSKKEKLLARLQATPRPTNFTWDELETLLSGHRFVFEGCKGSHCMFEHGSGTRLRISKTHPSGILKSYQIKCVIDALQEAGELGDK